MLENMLICTLCPSFIRTAPHSYALPLIRMHCCSFVFSLSLLHTPPSLRIHMHLRSFISPTARSHSCPRPHALWPYASVGASSASGPFRMYEGTPVVRLHYPGTSLQTNEPLAPLRPFATSQCVQMNRTTMAGWCACDGRGG